MKVALIMVVMSFTLEEGKLKNFILINRTYSYTVINVDFKRKYFTMIGDYLNGVLGINNLWERNRPLNIASIFTKAYKFCGRR